MPEHAPGGPSPAADEAADTAHAVVREQRREDGGFTAAVAWIVSNLTVTFTMIGAGTYLIYRVAYLTYYSRFGVTPEEVGMDYGGILTAQAGWGLLELLLVAGVLFYFRMRIARAQAYPQPIASENLVERAKDLNRRSGGAFPEAEREALNRAEHGRYLSKEVSGAAKGLTAVMLLIPVIGLFLTVSDALRAGTGPRIPSLSEPFQGRAVPVSALWLGSDKAPLLPVTYADLGFANAGTAPPGFLLLGERNGVVVLYDQRAGAVRLPRDKVLLISQPVR